MEYVSQCPHCGKILENAPEMEPVRLETDAPKKQLDPDYDPPLPGRKWPCILTGSISIAFSLFLFVILFFFDEPLEAQNAAVTLILLLIWFCFGLALLLCRHREPEETQKPVVVLREQKLVTGVGIFLWLLGSIFLFMAIAVAVAVADPVDGVTLFLAAIGVFLTFFGVWMILAGRNRCLFVFQDHSILYISSWGKQKKYEPGKITSVRLTVNRSIQLLNSNGKKLISVETNMRGTPRLAEWIESTDLAALVTPAMERQTESQAAEESLVQWREEYRTHWHDHLRAIRMGLWVVMILLIIGAVLPIPLYLYAGVKFRTVMAIAAVTPIPFLIFCIVFTPVLIFGDRPKNATAEWNAMYIQTFFASYLFTGAGNSLAGTLYMELLGDGAKKQRMGMDHSGGCNCCYGDCFMPSPYAKGKTLRSRIFYRTYQLLSWHGDFLLRQCGSMQTGSSLSCCHC